MTHHGSISPELAELREASDALRRAASALRLASVRTALGEPVARATAMHLDHGADRIRLAQVDPFIFDGPARAVERARVSVLDVMRDALRRSPDERVPVMFEQLSVHAVADGRVRTFARSHGLHASSLMSVFFRASLCAPKHWLLWMRFVYAAHLSEAGLTGAGAANYLNASSPQSFGRTVTTVLGVRMSVLMHDWRASGTLARFDALVRKHSDGFARLRLPVLRVRM